jgi:hypothetical protein
MPPVEPAFLPKNLLDRFRKKDAQSQLVRHLQFLAPFSRSGVITYGNKLMLAAHELNTGVCVFIPAKDTHSRHRVSMNPKEMSATDHQFHRKRIFASCVGNSQAVIQRRKSTFVSGCRHCSGC